MEGTPLHVAVHLYVLKHLILAGWLRRAELSVPRAHTEYVKSKGPVKLKPPSSREISGVCGEASFKRRDGCADNAN